ncbi:prepilin peptidase [Microterricola viridarii]|uniref:Prepilin leader peptidase/N-methyltransferase n=1 Tax=Microterricola viridarii TaxID=412690 RepID=A0A1H1PWW2_9MICO|nr:A24 family peptidase [Microterricola viridarii]SDS15682.1 leader peptidase (prepilin peptidase) / N-methyltransferase [Microterricola viridarii]
MVAVPVLVGLFGAFIGSFLNVVIFRVPQKLSVVSPPSACPRCGVRIKPWQNVPVLSWLLLRGSCASCQAPISARYPLVEGGTALFFGVVTWWWVASGTAAPLAALGADSADVASSLLLLLAFLYLAAITVVLTLIDLDHQILPNSIVLPSYLVSAVLLAESAALTGSYPALLGAAIGGAALFALYFLLALISPRGMGMGDVKLAGVLGLYLGYLGWGALIVGGFGAFLIGGVFGIALIVLRKAGRKSGIPFGPWMLLAAWLGIFFGESLWAAYLSLFGLAS